MAKMSRDEKIFKLGKVITDRKEILLGLEKMSTEAPEYWGIDCGLQYAERRYGKEVADHCLDLALKMGKRKPRTFAQLKKMSGYDDGHLENVLEALCQASLVEWHFENLDGKNPNHKKRWVLDKMSLYSSCAMRVLPASL